MLVICAYLGAMAGISALCYVFRARPGDGGEVAPSLSNENSQTKASPDGPIPDIVVTPCADKIKARGRSALTPETQAKIQEVLDFVNTPSEQFLLNENDKQSEAKLQVPHVDLPIYSSVRVSIKKPNEVIAELEQSRAKVEAWISELDKVINNDGTPPHDKHLDKRSKVSKQNKEAAVNSELKKHANDRFAKVKEEIAKRRVIVSTRVDAEKNSARRKWSATTDTSAATAYKRELIEVPKRVHENTPTSAKKRPAASPTSKQVSNSSSSTVDDNAASKMSAASKEEEGASKVGPSRNKPIVRRGPSTKQEGTVEAKETTVVKTKVKQEVAKVEAQKAKVPTKLMSSFEARMKYVPSGRQPRSPSPTHVSEIKSSSPPASKIPVLVNSRARPPVRAVKVSRETKVEASVKGKVVPPAVQKTKKRNTSEPPHPSGRDTTGGIAEELTERHSSHVRQDVKQERSCSWVQGDAMYRPVDCTPDQEDLGSIDDAEGNVALPELNIIGVRGSQSYSPQPSDIQAEVSYAKEFVTRVAKSGPIRLDTNDSLTRVKSQSTTKLMKHTSSQRSNSTPISVSKTVQMPQGTDDKVTVYFSVTLPRRGKSNVNWNGHDDSDHTITLGDEEVGNADVETRLDDDEVDSEGQVEYSGESVDDDDHSDEGVNHNEIYDFHDGSDDDPEFDCGSETNEDYDDCDYNSSEEQLF